MNETGAMTLIQVTKANTRWLEAVRALYMEAFPQIERKPFEQIVRLCEAGRMEILAIVDAGAFAGLAINMLWPQQRTALLDYYAIAAEKRGGGVGSRALALLLERFAGQTYIFEIEKLDAQAENAHERERRKAFYLRNGLKETGVFVNTYQTDFELLCPDGRVTFEQYRAVLVNTLGEEITRMLCPTPIAP